VKQLEAAHNTKDETNEHKTINSLSF